MPLQPLTLITGQVYDDWDGDGRHGGEEKSPVLPITVTLASSAGPIADTILSAGQFTFLGQPYGSYGISPGLTAASVAQATLDVNGGGSLAVPAVSPNVVRGTAWLDDNEDGRRQPWETPLAGINVTLDLTRTTTTDRNGRFQFFSVPTGTHALEAELPPGLVAAIPPINLDFRGAAVGIAAHPPAPPTSDSYIFLPMLVKAGPPAPDPQTHLSATPLSDPAWFAPASGPQRVRDIR